ncbi:MAG: WYL domain-containing protein [bacterium]|nr:WYL domain-containing protein [bacterium]
MSRNIEAVLHDLSRIYDRLQTVGGCTTVELSEHLNIPRKTVYRHLDYLRHLYGEDSIEKDGDVYRLTDEAPVIVSMTPHEHQALALGARVLDRIGMPLTESFDRLFLKLAGGDPGRARAASTRARAQAERAVAFIEPSLCRPVRDRNLASRLYALCAGDRPTGIRFMYRSRGQEQATERRVVPLGLVFASTWYLLGHTESRVPPVRMYALDRMDSLREEAFGPTHRPAFDLQAHLAPAWRLLVAEGEVRPVLLEMPLEMALEQKHPSQAIVDRREDACIVRFEVADPLEMTRFVMAHGERVKVLEPPELVEEVRRRLELAVGRVSARGAPT